MGVTKTTLTEGTGVTPQKGQTVVIEYTGWLKDPSKPGMKGTQYVSTPRPMQGVKALLITVNHRRFDSSVGRGDFKTKIGVGQVIRGMDLDPTEVSADPTADSHRDCRAKLTAPVLPAPGWDEGVTQMKVGEKATLDITSDYAYGER